MFRRAQWDANEAKLWREEKGPPPPLFLTPTQPPPPVICPIFAALSGCLLPIILSGSLAPSVYKAAQNQSPSSRPSACPVNYVCSHLYQSLNNQC